MVGTVLVHAKYTVISKLMICLDSADGCEAIEDEPLNSNFPSITLSWPESNIGVTHSFPCPCLDNPGGGASQPIVTCTCRGNFISKAMWQPVDYLQCGFTDITFKLCETQLVGTLCAKHGSTLFPMQKYVYLNYCMHHYGPGVDFFTELC